MTNLLRDVIPRFTAVDLLAEAYHPLVPGGWVKA